MGSEIAVRVDVFARRLSVQFGHNRDPPFHRRQRSAEASVQHLLGVRDAEHRPIFMARVYDYWLAVARAIQAAGLLPAEIYPGDLARQLLIYAIGALELWVHDELTDDQFEAQVEHGLAVQVFPFVPARLATGTHRAFGPSTSEGRHAL